MYVKSFQHILERIHYRNETLVCVVEGLEGVCDEELSGLFYIELYGQTDICERSLLYARKHPNSPPHILLLHGRQHRWQRASVVMTHTLHATYLFRSVFNFNRRSVNMTCLDSHSESYCRAGFVGQLLAVS